MERNVQCGFQPNYRKIKEKIMLYCFNGRHKSQFLELERRFFLK